MGSLFGQVWLWSLLSFVAGVALTWLVLVRPAKKELEELEERLLTSPRPAPVATPVAPVAAPAQDEYDDWPRDPTSPVDSLLGDEPPRYDVAGLQLDRRDERSDDLDDEHRPLSDFEERHVPEDERPRSLFERLTPEDDQAAGHDDPNRPDAGRTRAGHGDVDAGVVGRGLSGVDSFGAGQEAGEPESPAERTQLLPPTAPPAEPAAPPTEPTAPPEVEAFQPREVWREEPAVPEVYGEDADEPGNSPSHEEEDEPERPAEATALIPATALAQAIAEVDGRTDDRTHADDRFQPGRSQPDHSRDDRPEDDDRSQEERARADERAQAEQARADDFHAELARSRDAQLWPDHDLTGEYPVIRETPPPAGPAFTEPAFTEPAASGPAATEPAFTEPAATGPAFTEPAPDRREAERLSPRTEYISPFGADLTVDPEPPLTEPAHARPEPVHIQPEPFEPMHSQPEPFEPVYAPEQATAAPTTEPPVVIPAIAEPVIPEPSEHRAPDHAIPEQATPEHEAPEHAAPEEPAAERAVEEPRPVANSLFTEPEREAPAAPVSMFTPPDLGDEPAGPAHARPETPAITAHTDTPHTADTSHAETSRAGQTRAERARSLPSRSKPAKAEEPREPGRPRSLFEPLLTPEDIDDEPPVPPVTPRPPAPGNDQPFVPTLAPELLASSSGGLPQRPTRPANSPRTPPPAPLSPQPISPPPPRPVRPRPVGFSPSTGGRPATGATTRYQQPEGFNPRSPFGPGSVLPKSDGMAPAPDFHVKATLTGRRYYTGESANFRETRADVWFRTTSDAEKAGFRPAP
ncbi:hypothetical protein AB0I60_08340 [Actinosynnema sp. NPDC050436]|uniref:sunset domain-containing protein n=1 Tax=Actinosynnema sp. NPDC050436 TaxID=3155659 RepID=UPI0033E29F83